MALSPSQKDSIQHALSHFDFSPATANLIREALTAVVDDNHPFYWLRECWLNPTAHFQMLENQGPAITIGDVQRHILDYVIDRTNSFSLILDRDSFLRKLPQENLQTVFKSQQVAIDSGDLWELSPLHEKIYSRRIRLHQEKDTSSKGKIFAYVDISITLGNSLSLEHSIRLEEIPEIFANDAAYSRFVKRIKEEANEKSRKTAASFAINYLASKYPIAKHLEHAHRSASTSKIITNNYYFNLLIKEKIRFIDIIYASSEEADNLNHPNVIGLLKAGIITLEEAKRLNSLQISILANPTYYKLFLERKISLLDIKEVSERRSKFLNHPLVSNLIQQNRLTFQQAMQLPFDLKDLFTRPVYINFFMNNTIPWNIFLAFKEIHVALLLIPAVSNLILSKAISFADVSALLPEILDFLKQNLVLVEKKIISWETLQHTRKEILPQLYIDAYAQRLYAITIGQAYSMNKKKLDNLDELIGDIQHAAMQFCMPIHLLQESVISCFIIHIKTYLETIKDEIDQESVTNACQEFLQHLQKCDAIENIENPDTSALLSELMLIAQQTLMNLSREKFFLSEMDSMLDDNNLLFPAAKKRKFNKSDTLKVFCENLLELTKFNDKQPDLIFSIY